MTPPNRCATDVCFSQDHFTGKERDTESGTGRVSTGNDYFGARYYASSIGRFLSPDPSGLAYANAHDPQSLNLYSYVLNNPLVNTDPSGEECVWDDGSFDSADDKDSGSAEKCYGLGGTWVPPNLFENAILTNGQWNSNYGDWSGQANSNLAQNWTNASGTSDATPVGPSVTYNQYGVMQFHLDPNYNYDSRDFLNRPTSSIGPAPPPKKLTPGQIQYWCAVAALLSGGGTVPGGIDPSSPSTDTEEMGMMVNSGKATFENQPKKMEFQPLNGAAPPVEGAVNLVAVIGTAGACVSAVSAAQNGH